MGTILTIAVVGLLFLDQFLFPGGSHWPFFKILALVVMLVCLVEFYGLARGAGLQPSFEVGIASSIYYIFGKFEIGGPWVSANPLPILGLVVMLSAILRMRKAQTTGAVADVAVTVLGFLYITMLIGFVVDLRTMGLFALLLFLTVVKVGDVSAYYVGSALGKRKLIPWISPKKTVEGFFGGLAGSTLVALLWGLGGWPLWGLALFGLSVGLVGQLSDAVESMFKRDAAAKDSGGTLPEFGGVLDLVDSLLLSAPVAYYLAKWIAGTGTGMLL